MQTSFITIGMIVYNGEIFISNAIDSLLRQTHSNFELIISDNASTDNTQYICEQYRAKDSRIKYIRQENNIGSLMNYQYVLNAASGDYFMWAAADDIWGVDWVEKLLPISEAYKCLATGVFVPIDVNGAEIAHPASRRVLKYQGPPIFRRMKFFLEPGVLGKGNPIYGIMPTNAIKKIGIAQIQNDGIGAFTVYVYEILRHMEIRSHEGALYYKRQHENSAGDPALYVEREKSFRRIWGVIFGLILQPLPFKYFKKSFFYEKILIAFLYLPAFTWIMYVAIKNKLNILAKGR